MGTVRNHFVGNATEGVPYRAKEELVEHVDPPRPRQSPLTWLALLLALAAVAGAGALSLALRKKACPLCIAQFAFVTGSAAILLFGIFSRELPRGVPSLLALPTTIAGVAISLLQSTYVARGTHECPPGVWDLGSAPQQSLAVLGLLASLLVLDLVACGRMIGMTLGSMVGAAIALLFVLAAPESTGPDYTRPIHEDVCRRKKALPEPEKDRDDSSTEIDPKTGIPLPMKQED